MKFSKNEFLSNAPITISFLLELTLNVKDLNKPSTLNGVVFKKI